MKISRIILSVLTLFVVLAGVYFFTDLLGDRETRRAVEEVLLETPEKNMQVSDIPRQIANDPDAGILINDQNIQIEREEVENAPLVTTDNIPVGEYIQSADDSSPLPVQGVNESQEVTEVPQAPTSVGTVSAVQTENTIDSNETDALEMSVPPVPEM